eukprot:COSAG01_NODE_57236_length_313_cov_1.205607_1_plen_87_part_01
MVNQANGTARQTSWVRAATDLAKSVPFIGMIMSALNIAKDGATGEESSKRRQESSIVDSIGQPHVVFTNPIGVKVKNPIVGDGAPEA